MTISIVIPFYNEEEAFQETLDPLLKELEVSKVTYELILVDNGSWDKTGYLIDQAMIKNPRLKKVCVDKNEGYGWGIINGLKSTTGNYVGFICGDGQITARDVVKTVQFAIKENYNLVKVQRKKRKDGFLRVVVTRIYNWIVPYIFSLKTRDINGTPKIFSRELYEQLDLQSKDWFIDAEIMIKSDILGVHFQELPVTFNARKKGASHVSVLKAILEFVKNVYQFKTSRHYKSWKESKRLS